MPLLDDQAPLLRRTLSSTLAAIRRRAEGTEVRVPLPWPALEEHFHGGWLSGSYFLMGQTSIGKTAFAVQVAHHAAKSGIPVLYIGLEHRPDDIALRLLACEQGTAWSALLHDVDMEQLQAVSETAFRLAVKRELPIRVCAPMASFDAEQLEALVGAFAEANEARPILVLVDYAQLIGAHGDARARVANVAALCRRLAMRHDAVILGVSSVSRASQEAFETARKNEDPHELLAVGKDAGELEYSADAVMALGVDPPVAGSPTRKAWVAIPKNRSGLTGFVDLEFTGTGFSAAGKRRKLK